MNRTNCAYSFPFELTSLDQIDDDDNIIVKKTQTHINATITELPTLEWKLGKAWK